MARKPKGLRGQPWIEQIFQAEAARNGNLIRRKIASVHQFASEALLEAEVKRRGFHMIVSGDQYVILCNPGQFQVVC
ncbi:hypothetical protein ACU8KI_01005 [Rhizobium leguminosarum]